MATAVSVQINLRNVEALTNIRDKLDRLRDFHAVVGIRLLTGMSNRLVESYKAGGRRTGRLLNSLQLNAPGNVFEPTQLGGSVGSNVEYAAMQDQGGDITPKPPRRLLAIPIPDALKRTNQNWPSDLDPARQVLKFVPTDTGGVLVDDEGILGFGKGILYVLTGRVTLEPKHMTRVERAEIVEIERDWVRFMGGSAPNAA